MINLPKGTKDVLPQNSYKWHYVEDKIRKVTKANGVSEIRTPTFEHTELFLRGVGETTDVVNKEMYTFLDKGNRSITLKPEGTAGVGRSYIENGLKNLTMPVKMYYITPVFRYEQPQKGRLREHHQFGVEMYGSKNASIDAEVINIAKSLFDELGISVKLYINSMGCKTCRAEYNKALKEYFASVKSELCPTCQERYEKNPLRILDCKSQICKDLCKDAPKITDFLCEDCNGHFNSLKSYLEILGIDYEVNPFIVRGLDYYTKTVFEFVTTALGSQGTVCGGGRYDNLIEELGGASTPGVGFGMGLERVIMLMEELNLPFGDTLDADVYLVGIGEEGYKKAFELAMSLRKQGVHAEVDHMQRSVKAQFKHADKLKSKYVIAIGDGELESKTVNCKDMQTGTSVELTFEELMTFKY